MVKIQGMVLAVAFLSGEGMCIELGGTTTHHTLLHYNSSDHAQHHTVTHVPHYTILQTISRHITSHHSDLSHTRSIYISFLSPLKG